MSDSVNGSRNGSRAIPGGKGKEEERNGISSLLSLRIAQVVTREAPRSEAER